MGPMKEDRISGTSEQVRALQESILEKGDQITHAILEYMRAVNATGHITPTPPWPKTDEIIARLTYPARLLELVISVPTVSRGPSPVK